MFSGWFLLVVVHVRERWQATLSSSVARRNLLWHCVPDVMGRSKDDDGGTEHIDNLALA